MWCIIVLSFVQLNVHTCIGGLHRVAAAREALVVTCNAMERFTECTKIQAIGCLILGWAVKDKAHGMLHSIHQALVEVIFEVHIDNVFVTMSHLILLDTTTFILRVEPTLFLCSSLHCSSLHC
jgi:hypothetical protein